MSPTPNKPRVARDPQAARRAVEARLARDYDAILNPEDKLYSSEDLISATTGCQGLLPLPDGQADGGGGGEAARLAARSSPPSQSVMSYIDIEGLQAPEHRRRQHARRADRRHGGHRAPP